jgi:hypothetical protein
VRTEAEPIARGLHRRWWDLGRRGKRHPIVAVASSAAAAEAGRHGV